MQRRLGNRNYLNLLIAVGTVITFILVFNAFFANDEEQSDVKWSQEISRSMNNFVKPRLNEDNDGRKIAPQMPVVVTRVVVKTVDGPVIMVNKPIKEEKKQITDLSYL